MQSNPIESAPGNQFVILQDERKDSDVYEIARWSVERGDWIRKDGEPIQIIPSHWLPLDHLSRLQQGGPRGWRRFGLRAALFATAGLAMMFVPLVLNNWAGPWEKESLFVAGSTTGSPEGGSQDAPNSPIRPSSASRRPKELASKSKLLRASWHRPERISEL